jgi:hypothetical protein
VIVHEEGKDAKGENVKGGAKKEEGHEASESDEPEHD